MWETKEFKSEKAMSKWISKNGSKYQYEEIFLNNAYGLEVRKLRKIM